MSSSARSSSAGVPVGLRAGGLAASSSRCGSARSSAAILPRRAPGPVARLRTTDAQVRFVDRLHAAANRTHSKSIRARRAVIGAVAAVVLAGGGGATWAAGPVRHRPRRDRRRPGVRGGQGSGSGHRRPPPGTVTGYLRLRRRPTSRSPQVTTGSRRRHRHLLRRRRRAHRRHQRCGRRSRRGRVRREHHREHLATSPPTTTPCFAINGDYYGFRDTGIVIRNGVVFRDEGARAGPRVLPRRHGRGLRRDRRRLPTELVADGVWNTLSFGPALARRTARSSPASTTSRSTRTSATTRSRASSRAPRSA